MPTTPPADSRSTAVSRRQFLQATGAASLAVATGTAATSVLASSQLPSCRAKNAILIHLVGGASQLETFDPKPQAPVEIRSPAGAISTAVPGVQISGWLPKIASVLDRCTLIRSVHHDGPATHEAGLRALWGNPATPSQPYHHLGDQWASQRGVAPAERHIVLSNSLGDFGWESLADLRSASSFWGELSNSVRQQLLTGTRSSERDSRYDDSVRYGSSVLGRRCLRARQLLAAGTRVVTIHDYSTVFDQVTWDMHTTGARLPTTLADYQQTLCPALDQAVSTLILDLDQRGLLDETLVAVVTEMGRTPRFNLYGGRDHHPGAWSVLVAGGGFPRGAVWGSTDEHAETVRDQPISAAELQQLLLTV